MVAIVQLKRRIASAHIFSIVESILSHWQELCPVILFEIDKSLDIGFYWIVLTFGLAVCLRMESYEKF